MKQLFVIIYLNKIQQMARHFGWIFGAKVIKTT